MHSTPKPLPETRICCRCKTEKPLTTEFFYRCWSGTYGFQSNCKECTRTKYAAWLNTPEGRATYREYAKKHRETPGYNEKHRAYRETPKALWRLYQDGAVRRGLPYELTVEDFETRFWQKPCWYCGEVIRTAGVDRLYNDQGYTIPNTVPCCSTCNLMKRKSTPSEFIAKCREIAAKHPVST